MLLKTFKSHLMMPSLRNKILDLQQEPCSKHILTKNKQNKQCEEPYGWIARTKMHG